MKIGINTLIAMLNSRVDRYRAPHALRGTPKRKHWKAKNNASPSRRFGIKVRP